MLRVWAVLLLCAGCFSEPGRPSERDGGGDDGSDAGSDGSINTAAPTAHVISTAWFSAGNGSLQMSRNGWFILGNNIPDNEILLLIANVDNGNPTMYETPLAAGWTNLSQVYVGGDGQTAIAAVKRASGEPGSYGTAYHAGIEGQSSGASAIALIGIDGVDPSTPLESIKIDAHHNTDTNVNGTNQNAMLQAAGTLQTTVEDSLLIYAMGVDWLPAEGDATFGLPPGYSKLAFLTDENAAAPPYQYFWTTEMIATRTQHAIGPTQAVIGTMTSNAFEGSPDEYAHGGTWGMLISIPPHG